MGARSVEVGVIDAETFEAVTGEKVDTDRIVVSLEGSADGVALDAAGARSLARDLLAAAEEISRAKA